MKKIISIAAIIISSLIVKAQTYTWTGYGHIADYETDTIRIDVNGMTAAIDTNYGVARICFDIYHTYKSDLSISLIAPDGTLVPLVAGTGSSADNFIGTCMAMDGIPFANGQPPFTGSFLPVGDISNVNNGQNPNGIWLLLVKDIASPDTGSVRMASITFTNNPPRSNGTGGSSAGPAGPFICSTCVCPGGSAGCDLLPDVTASAKEILMNHTEVAGGLYIANATPNIGYGPIELYGVDSCFCGGTLVPCNTVCPDGQDLKHIIRQRIYRKVPGNDTLSFYDRDAGVMTFHPEHGHLHVDNWSNYTLRTATDNPDATTWPIIGTGVKQSFCLVNLGTCAGEPGECLANNGDTVLTVPNNNFGFHSGCGLNQGIYPGNFDRYSISLNDSIPLVNVCNGNYYIVSITDPENKFLESDENNNWVAVPITLTKQNTAPLISANRSGILCQGDSIILTASAAPNYIWSTGDTSRSISVKTGGTFTVSTSCGTSTATSLPYTTSILPPGAAASVSIAVTAGNNPSCAHTPISFTAMPTYGGSAPVYQWKVNGSNTGTNSNRYTTSGLISGQKVSCVITSDIPCLANAPAASDTITVTVNPVGEPSIFVIQTKGSNPQCLGDTAAFTAVVTNGAGTTYQWKINGTPAGTNADTFSTTALTNGQIVSCAISSTAICPAKAAIGDETSTSATNSCLGAAYPSYYGNGRQQYLIRASELTEMGLVAGNITSLSFSTAGALGNPAILKGYTIKMAATDAMQLANNFLSAAFTTVASPVDYIPVLNSVNTHNFSTPFYWNGESNIVVDICFSNQVIGRRGYQTYQSATPFISTVYYQADSTGGASACTTQVTWDTGSVRPYMIFTSSGIKHLSSNEIRMIVNSAVAPSVAISITKGNNPQCAGDTISFKATPDNTGAGPVYQWTKNGVDINGETYNTYTTASIQHNDTIRCKMASGLTCGPLMHVVSNEITIKTALPVYTFTGNGNWNLPSNWVNNLIPPSKLLACSEIIINPADTKECILNVPQLIAPGSKLTVVEGKKFRVMGNLLILQ